MQKLRVTTEGKGVPGEVVEGEVRMRKTVKQLLRKTVTACLIAAMLVGVMPVDMLKVEMRKVGAANKVLSSSAIANYFKGRVGDSVAEASCLSFIANGFVSLGATWSSADCAYEYGKTHIVSTSMDNIPIGADVFFLWNENYSYTKYTCGDHYCHHIGVYVGNGEVIHTSNKKVRMNTISELLSYNMDFWGWGYHGNVTVVQDAVTFDTYTQPTNISDSSATVGVWLDNPNAKTISSMGFEYGTQQDNMQRVEVTTGVTWTRPNLLYDIGSYVGLSPNTNYYIRFYATVDDATYFSNFLQFRTTGTSFDTYEISNISDNTATISVWLDNPNGMTISSMGFLYGTQQDSLQRVEVTTGVAWTRANLIYDISNYVGGLNSGTVYYYQFYAIANDKEYKSSICNFQTTGQSDTQAPIISNAYTTQCSNNGYTVIAEVSDNVRVTDVWFPTKRSDQVGDEAWIWYHGTKNADGTFSYTVNINEFQNIGGIYHTHIYAYDAAGNYSKWELNQYVDTTPPVITDAKIISVDGGGYTVECTVTDNVGVDRVQFPTWTEYDGQDDLPAAWEVNSAASGTVNGKSLPQSKLHYFEDYKQLLYYICSRFLLKSGL